MLDPGVPLQVVPGEPVLEVKAFEVISDLEGRAVRDARHGAVYRLAEEPAAGWDEGTKNGPDRSALLGHNFVYQETKPHGFYSSYFHQRISS